MNDEKESKRREILERWTFAFRLAVPASTTDDRFELIFRLEFALLMKPELL